jgi:hypothetical protein
MLGKVRIDLNGLIADRFAKAENKSKSFPAGSKVRVVKITDDCVYVEDEKNFIIT